MKKSANLDVIQNSFAVQAQRFEAPSMHFSKQEYLDYTVRCIAPSSRDRVLEVASGTCACGRALASHARAVTCLDATYQMLEIGRQQADRLGLDNMTFILGDAGDLPFLNCSFDLVVSRLAFHHFPEADTPFAEMVRVLRPGGTLALIDMEAAEASLRATEDQYEKLRDPSHVKNLSSHEMSRLFDSHNLSIRHCERTRIPVSLESGLELTQTPPGKRHIIQTAMQREIEGLEATGFAPYRKDGAIYFDQRWLLIVGVKP